MNEAFIVPGIVFFVLAFIGATIYLVYYLEKQRREGIEKIARQNGWRFDAKLQVHEKLQNKFHRFVTGQQKSKNVVEFRQNSSEVVSFDHGILQSNGKSSSYYFKTVQVREITEKDFPFGFLKIKKGFLSYFTFKNKIKDDELKKKYLLFIDDKKFKADAENDTSDEKLFLSEHKVKEFSSLFPNYDVEFFGDQILIYKTVGSWGGQSIVKPEGYRQFITDGNAIARFFDNL